MSIHHPSSMIQHFVFKKKGGNYLQLRSNNFRTEVDSHRQIGWLAENTGNDSSMTCWRIVVTFLRRRQSLGTLDHVGSTTSCSVPCGSSGRNATTRTIIDTQEHAVIQQRSHGLFLVHPDHDRRRTRRYNNDPRLGIRALSSARVPSRLLGRKSSVR